MDNNTKFFGTAYQEQPDENNRKYLVVIGVIFLFALVTFGLWFFLIRRNDFSVVSPFAKLARSGGNKNQQLEKTVENPLNGIMFDTVSSDVWVNERPLAVMVNNFTEARPQSGLDKADMVYEIVAEGGITRFLAFYLSDSPLKVGPIRSTREYYLILVKEIGDAMVMHIGWSPQALQAIETWPVRSLIRLGLNCDEVLPDPTDTYCWRNKTRVDGGVPWEHTAYGNISELRKKGIDAGWEGKPDSFTSWKFTDDKNLYSTRSSATEISIDFWDRNDYSAFFRYNSDTNSYLRFTGYDENNNPLPHIDNETKKQLETTTLVVQYVEEVPVEGDEKGRLDYKFVGSGDALIFMNGKVIECTWSKASRDARTLFYDKDAGQEVQFARGKIWISVVPDRNKNLVVYK